MPAFVFCLWKAVITALPQSAELTAPSGREPERKWNRLTVKELYEKVCYRVPKEAVPDERKFINFLEDTLCELEVLVEKKYLWLNTGAEKHPTGVSDEKIWCNDLFHIAMIENICYLCTLDGDKKSLFYKYVEEGKRRVRERQSDGKIRVMPKW